MNIVTQKTNKLIVVADENGKIRTALWPGVHSEGAPTETGIGLSSGQVAHEVAVPDELYQLARPNLQDYVVQESKGGPAKLIKKGR